MAFFGPEQPIAFFVQPGHGFLFWGAVLALTYFSWAPTA
jgi:hypothetical protein